MSDMHPGIRGRTALVTGGSRGIGAGIARALAIAGARVIVNGRDGTALRQVTDSIAGVGGEAHAVAADVTDEPSVWRLREEAERAFGPVSFLVLSAGGNGAATPLVEESVERWRRILDTNLTSAFLTLRAFLPPMLAEGRGAIVAISSSAGRQLSGATTAYAAAKAGLQVLIRQLALDVGPNGVRANTIAPSAIATDRLAAQPAAVRERIAEGFPLRSLGEVDDVVEAALFLLSDRSRWITGVTLDVAGGRVML